MHTSTIYLRQTNKKWTVLFWKWEQCDWLESPACHGIGRCFLLFGIWARTASQVINESTSLTTIKNLYLLISYHSFCISITVVVPSGNSSICVGVEHCISKWQVVKEFDRRNGLSPCRQHEVTFTWFTRYPFLEFANCLEFISKTSSVSLLLTMQRELQIGELPTPCSVL